MHVCKKCQISKPLSDYEKEPRSANGRRYQCKKCRNEVRRIWAEKNKIEIAAKRKARRVATGGAGAAYAMARRRDYPVRALILGAKRRAKKKGLAYDLEDHAELLEVRMEKRICEMTGVTLKTYDGTGRGPTTMSIDRIVPAKGYVYSNVRIICWAMNCAMGTWGEEALREILAGYK